METDVIALTRHTHRANGIRHEARCASCEKTNATIDDIGASVWDHVIHALLPGYRSEGVREAYLARPASRHAAYAPSSHIRVEVIERLSGTSIAVLWQDATRCRYVDQVWISCRARVQGRCAVSGAVIRREDSIYKPRVRTAPPANANAMILASVVEQMSSMVGEDGTR
ncbi:uncharacterized protein DUF3331 [Paraburkholderia sp. RAU2J]|nr:uncharacterized protein DUF3331 [Paraburkholderia sp. RAU2J]